MPDPEKAPAAVNQAARRGTLPKRFYQDVSVKDEPQGRASLLLDGRPVRTPGKALLILPNREFAEAVAEEWRAQKSEIDPETMPLTRLANSVIDGVAGREAEVIDDILGYAGSDLLCYRTEGPDKLVSLQERHWDPVVAWSKSDLGAPLFLAAGVMPVEQAPASLAMIRRRLAGLEAWSLASLHVMTGLTGSALLALAVTLGRLTPEEAWDAAHVDEDFQISQWGEDSEARDRRLRRRRDFDAAVRLLALADAAAR